SYAAYIGGCSATSNVLAGKIYGIPVKGTHAHSWVMSYPNELEAFERYAHAMPNNCIFLVDTYDTADGVKHAIKVGKQLEANGYKLVGIRLDSGDLAYLSIEARKMLDAAGFKDTQILASNDLDEHVIQSLKDQAAAIDIWGVGTKLATAYDQPALNGVYKLSAVKEPGRDWEYKLKLSEQSAKISTPGFQQIRRFSGRLAAEPSYFAGDMIYNELEPPDGGTNVIIDPLDFTRRKAFSSNTPYQDLLVQIFKEGQLIYDQPQLEGIKTLVREQLDHLHPTIKRILNPHEYPVGLEQGLHKLKTELILETRKIEAADRDDATKHGQW
ncbi:MAG: nicotinate phosphoribosyltransferase, partial [Terriglobales bacterium]